MKLLFMISYFAIVSSFALNFYLIHQQQQHQQPSYNYFLDKFSLCHRIKVNMPSFLQISKELTSIPCPAHFWYLKLFNMKYHSNQPFENILNRIKTKKAHNSAFSHLLLFFLLLLLLFLHNSFSGENNN